MGYRPLTVHQTPARQTTRSGTRRLAWIGLLTVASTLSVSCSKSHKAADPKDVTKALNAALQAHVDGKLDEAAADYRKVLDLDKNNKFALYNLGLLAQNAGRPDEAETQYRRVLQIDPKYEPALFNLAIVRTAKGDTAEAISLYRQAVAGNDNDAAAHLTLGLLLKKTGDTAGGDAEIKRAAELNPALVTSTTTAAGGTTTTTRKH